MDAVFQTIWELSLFMLPVILLLSLFSDTLGKRYGVGRRYLLWMLVAIRLCLPIQISLPAPMEQIPLPSIQKEAKEMLQKRTEPVVLQEETAVPVDTFIIEAEDGQAPPTVNLDANSSYQKPVDFFLAYPDVLWMLGVCSFLLWQAGKYISFRRLLKRDRQEVQDNKIKEDYAAICTALEMKKQPALYVCESITTPFCIGFLKSEVYLNREKNENITLILKHELLHIKRRDLWAKGLLMLARALHFFNPFVYWMAKKAERDLESACDLQVVAGASLEERQAYSMAILQTIRQSRQKTTLTTAFSSQKEELKKRFSVILDMQPKKRGTALFTAAVVFLTAGTAFVGCTAPEPQKAPESKVIYGEYTEKLVQELYEAKIPYIGNHIAVGKIQGLLPLPNGITGHEEGMELFTTEEPYGAMRHLNWTITEETAYEHAGEGWMDARWASIHGMIFLALVENAGYYTYAFHNATGKGLPEQDAVMLPITISRESCKAFFGDTDLRTFAADIDTFTTFVSAINRYYYEGIETEEDIYHLLHEMTDEEKQERMQGMLANDVEEAKWKDKSMSYQMIHADSLVHEIAMQKLTSSNPSDYSNCLEYKEILEIGEPALREFLSCFAQGRAGNGLEGYIMMYACQELLGMERNNELSPTEWYQMYAMLDSVLLPAFRYEESEYTQELVQQYALGNPNIEKWSIAAAGEDVRLKAVYDALESKYNAKGIALGHEVSIYAPMIYKIKETENTMEVFTTIFTSHQTLTRTNQGYAIQEEGGSVIPTKLEFAKQGGIWVLTDWIESKDGNLYEPSILEFCKEDKRLAKKLMNSEGVQELFWQNTLYYMKAHFGDMDIPIYQNSYMKEALYEKLSQNLDIVLTYEE